MITIKELIDNTGDDPLEFIKQNNIKLFVVPLKHDAYILINFKSTPSIFLSNNLTKKRQSFLLWHEIVHFLHYKAYPNEQNIDHKELLANVFACLKVIDNEMKEIIKNMLICNGCEIKIANEFICFVQEAVFEKIL